MIKKVLFISILMLLVFNIGFWIYLYRDSYNTQFDAKYWEERYNKSQWMLNPTCDTRDPHINPKTCTWDNEYYAITGRFIVLNPAEQISIGDDGLYTFAGYKYIHGQDPTLMNAEIPPFGKYLIGLSILVFKNQNYFGIITGVVVLIGLYFLNLAIFKNKLFALIPTTLFSLEPLFYTQLQSTYLDLLHLGLLLFSFVFVLKKKYIGAGIFLGLMAATKSPGTTFALGIVSMGAYVVISGKMDQIKKFALFFIPSSFIVFTLTYARFFLLGNSPVEFLKVQKWIINFYADGTQSKIGNVLQMIILDKWYLWWEKKYGSIDEWRITWPILFLGYLFAIGKKAYQVIKTKKVVQEPIWLVLIWCSCYLVFLIFIPVWPRYLLLLLPFLYTIFVWLIIQSVPILRPKTKIKKK